MAAENHIGRSYSDSVVKTILGSEYLSRCCFILCFGFLFFCDPSAKSLNFSIFWLSSPDESSADNTILIVICVILSTILLIGATLVTVYVYRQR